MDGIRYGKVDRKTKETDINVEFNIDGSGEYMIDTGIGFFDHMLSLFAKHGLFDLTVKCKGDLEVDDHHTVEDCGIAIAEAVRLALGDKSGIKRYGFSSIVHDETWVMVSLDFSGRPYVSTDTRLLEGSTVKFDVELLDEFVRAFAFNCGMTLHVKIVEGSNGHHMIESVFKALGRAIDDAAVIDPRVKGVPSTKGTL